jgi:hypothetical protein
MGQMLRLPEQLERIGHLAMDNYPVNGQVKEDPQSNVSAPSLPKAMAKVDSPRRKDFDFEDGSMNRWTYQCC